MKYSTAGSFRAALETRLRQESTERGLAVGRLRKIVVFDRLLARMTRVSPEGWILKGGFALELRLPDRARTTRDIDVDRAGSVDEATADLQAAAALDLGDYFEFAIEIVDRGEGVAPGGGVRYRAISVLAGREFERVTIDVGFGDRISDAPDQLRGPALLAFADIEPATIPTAPLRQQLAEKVHAYTRTYGQGEASSRAKDLIDIVLISGLEDLDLEELQGAVDATFAERGTHDLPEKLPHPPADWRDAYRRLATEVKVEIEPSAGYVRANALLAPILARVTERRTWRVSQQRWNEPDSS